MQQYYYHAFLVKQPDLNWRNPEVEKAMSGVIPDAAGASGAAEDS